jgi:hypothetical protein
MSRTQEQKHVHVGFDDMDEEEEEVFDNDPDEEDEDDGDALSSSPSIPDDVSCPPLSRALTLTLGDRISTLILCMHCIRLLPQLKDKRTQSKETCWSSSMIRTVTGGLFAL